MAQTPSRYWLAWLPLPGAIALAWLVYQPWRARAFDVLDFSEFLPLLTRPTGLLSRFTALADYYVGLHGRFNVLSYLALASKWSWLGPNPLLWQLLRAVLLAGIAMLCYLLLRRLGSDRLAAAIGSVLMLFSYSAAVPWIRLTMGEPLGTACVLGAALVAASPRAGGGWGRPLLLGLLMAAAVLAKEMLVLWTPAVVLLAASSGAARRRPMMAAVVGALVAFVPVVLAARSPGVTGYAASYGAGAFGPGRWLELFQRQLLPWPITGRGDAATMFLAAILFVAVIAGGFRLGLRDSEWRRRCRIGLAIGLGLPLLGSLAYLPWPLYFGFYGYPFLVGPALLLATALTVLRARSARLGRLAVGAALVMTVLVIPESIRLADSVAAQQEVMTALADTLPRVRPADRILVAVTIPPMQPWQGIGPSLVRYAAAMTPALPLPPAADVSCADAAEILRTRPPPPGVVLISFDTGCGPLPDPDVQLARRFSVWRWEPPGFGSEGARATLRVTR